MTEWVRLRLTLDTFDPEPFEHHRDRVAADGLRLTTYAALGDTPANRRLLHSLNRECAADIPERGEFHSFEEYVAERIEVPSFAGDGVVIAVDAEARWVGMCAVSAHPEQALGFVEMTGVRRSHRGRGLSLAMKLDAIAFARSAGLAVLRTTHHPDNAAAIAANRRLGFVDA